MKIRFKFLLALYLILAAGPSYAASPATCTGTTTGIIFTYDVFNTANTNSTGSITVTCTNTTTATVNIGISSYSGVFIPRKMKISGVSTDLLNYNLYIDPAYANVWGDGTGGTSNFVGQVKKNFPATLTVYGSIPAGQDVSAGTYSDTLTVTVLP